MQSPAHPVDIVSNIPPNAPLTLCQTFCRMFRQLFADISSTFCKHSADILLNTLSNQCSIKHSVKPSADIPSNILSTFCRQFVEPSAALFQFARARWSCEILRCFSHQTRLDVKMLHANLTTECHLRNIVCQDHQRLLLHNGLEHAPCIVMA